MDEKHTKHITPNQARNLRAEAQLHQSDIAFLLDIKNVGRISKWEQGTSNPSIEHLIGLSIIYQRLPDEIYYGLRKKIARKIEVRRRLLFERKRKKKKKGRDTGG